jgi:hypothetical protein
VEFEEGEIFPAMRDSGVDAARLATDLRSGDRQAS